MAACLCAGLGWFVQQPGVISLAVTRTTTLDSLGACQGVSYQDGRAYLYGDREVGVLRAYTINRDSLVYKGPEIRLTVAGKDVINHPTGIARHGTLPTFIGNSIRVGDPSKPSTPADWRAVIYAIDWAGLLRTHTLDGNLLRTIDDDAAVQGTRPEYVYYQNKWYVATADYGNHANAVRLYNPARLATAKKTSEPGVLARQFTCSPWVQNLHWIPEKGILVLIQNQIEGRRWRFTFVDLAKSIEAGREQVINTIDMDKADELEGFALLNDSTGLAVTSSRTNNVHTVGLRR
ncbi:hypothetical protein J2I47_03040 [Fibrella sp. HMF5335]|uniref:Uncharacterized protein n=1 Tax=Fibrella rubiginis TaxID=2817060 RepID=A0A939K4L1_9BACT|nr:hypothetical protein [Fibrella rubiginis]